MKKLLLTALLLNPLGAVVFAQTADVAVLAYSADELAAKFAGKNRKEIVSSITTIPVYEQTFTSINGTEYEAVRYGKTNQDYRLFLYKFKFPQPLVAVVDNAKGIMALNQRYQIDIPLMEQDIAAHTSASLNTVQDVASGNTYNVYQNGNEYLVFHNGVLVRSFDNAQEYAAFMATVTASNSAYAAQQAQEQTALEQARLNQQASQNYVTTTRYYYNPVSTILFGGLVWSAIHGWHRPHHHVHPQPAPPPLRVHGHRPPAPGHGLPPLKRSGPPAGTPMMRNVDGKFMRH